MNNIRRGNDTQNFNIDDFLPQYFSGIPSDMLRIYVNYRDGVTPHDFGGYTVSTYYGSIETFLSNYNPLYDGMSHGDKIVLITITNSVDNDGSFPSHADVVTNLANLSNNYNFKYYAFPVYYVTRPSVISEYGEDDLFVYLADEEVYDTVEEAPSISNPGSSFPLFDNPLIEEYVYSTADLRNSHCEIDCGNECSNLDSYKGALDDIADMAGELVDMMENESHVTNDTFENIAKLYELLSVYLHYNDISNSYDYTTSPYNVNGYHNFYCYKDEPVIAHELVANSIDPCDGNDHSSAYQSIAESLVGRNPLVGDITLVFGGISTTFTSQNEIDDFISSLWQHFWNIASGYSDFVEGGVAVSNSAVGLNVYANVNATRYVDNEDDLKEMIGESDASSITYFLYNSAEYSDQYLDEIARIGVSCYIQDVNEDMPIHNLDLVSLVAAAFGNGFSQYVVTEVTESVTVSHSVFSRHTEHVYLDGEPAEDFDDIDKRCSEDNSFTISFKPGVGFVSFHSYRPDMYLWTADDMFSWRNGSNRIYRHNVEGSYQNFYGDTYPFVVEVVDRNPNTVYGPQVMDSISMMVKADRYVDGSFNEERNVFFGKAYFYNSRQCSLVHDIVAKGGLSSSNYFDEYLSNEMDRFKISAERRESLWHINGLRNYRTDYDTPLHLYDIGARNDFMDNLDMNGWIDKALDESLLDAAKDWWEVEPFMDNFLCQRYFYNPDDENIRLKVMLSTTAKSQSVDNVLK